MVGGGGSGFVVAQRGDGEEVDAGGGDGGGFLGNVAGGVGLGEFAPLGLRLAEVGERQAPPGGLAAEGVDRGHVPTPMR